MRTFSANCWHILACGFLFFALCLGLEYITATQVRLKFSRQYLIASEVPVVIGSIACLFTACLATESVLCSVIHQAICAVEFA